MTRLLEMDEAQGQVGRSGQDSGWQGPSPVFICNIHSHAQMHAWLDMYVSKGLEACFIKKKQNKNN